MILGERLDGSHAEPVGKVGSWWVFADMEGRGVEVRRSTGSKPLACLTAVSARELADLLVMAAAASERMMRDELDS